MRRGDAFPRDRLRVGDAATLARAASRTVTALAVSSAARRMAALRLAVVKMACLAFLFRCSWRRRVLTLLSYSASDANRTQSRPTASGAHQAMACQVRIKSQLALEWHP